VESGAEDAEDDHERGEEEEGADLAAAFGLLRGLLRSGTRRSWAGGLQTAYLRG
jgi:hypothetical protein